MSALIMKHGVWAAALVLSAVALPAQDAMAQARGTPNALQGFAQNRNEPIKIESNTLEVRDKDKIATFIDNVRVTQGDTLLETKRLIVFYDEEAATGPSAQKRAPSSVAPGAQSIRRLEAKGGVVVTQKDQTAVGEEGIYDMRSNSVTLIGKVVVTQGQNVVRGERLRVDLTTGTSVVESGTASQTPGRVEAIFTPSAPPNAAPAATPAPRNATQPPRNPPSAARPQTNTRPPAPPAADRNRPTATPGQPLRVN
jgi:lipopolysaccharide export system protein LptA